RAGLRPIDPRDVAAQQSAEAAPELRRNGVAGGRAVGHDDRARGAAISRALAGIGDRRIPQPEVVAGLRANGCAGRQGDDEDTADDEATPSRLEEGHVCAAYYR